jgi:Lon protease-like protein
VPDLENILSGLERLKAFPLPQGVLLPGGTLPLLVYEPRYKALVNAALRHDRLLAVAMLDPESGPDPEGRPRMRPLACLGSIEQAERRPDGSFEILVAGLSRIRIDAELPPSEPYREVVARFPDEPTPAELRGIETVRHAIRALWGSLPRDRQQALSPSTLRIADPGTFCDAVASAIVEDSEELQRILEALDIGERIERLLSQIGALLFASLGTPSARKPC